MNTEEINNIIKKQQHGEYVKNTAFISNSLLRKQDIDFEMTDEEKTEYDKCKNDPIYFVETYCKVETKDGLKNVKLTNAQKALLNSNKDEHIMQDRNSGTTAGIAFKNTHDMLFKGKNIGIVAKKNAYSELLNKIKTCYKNLPYFLQKGVTHFNMLEIQLEDKSGVSQITTSNYLGKTYNDVVMLNNCSASEETVKTVYASVLPCVKSIDGNIITVDDNVEAKTKSLNGNCIVFESIK